MEHSLYIDEASHFNLLLTSSTLENYNLKKKKYFNKTLNIKTLCHFNTVISFFSRCLVGLSCRGVYWEKVLMKMFWRLQLPTELRRNCKIENRGSSITRHRLENTWWLSLDVWLLTMLLALITVHVLAWGCSFCFWATFLFEESPGW